MAITYNNRDTFISVVAWILILGGLASGWGWLGRLTSSLMFLSMDVTTITGYVIGVIISAAAVWCGLGLRNRQRSRLTVLIPFLWIYIVWIIALNVYSYLPLLDLMSSGGTGSSGFSDTMQYALTQTVFVSIRVVVESAVILWVIGQLSKPLVREEFEPN